MNTAMLWDLKRDQLFRIPGCDMVLRFEKMDGMYCRAFTPYGAMVNFCSRQAMEIVEPSEAKDLVCSFCLVPTDGEPCGASS